MFVSILFGILKYFNILKIWGNFLHYVVMVPSILPDLTLEEAFETTKVFSTAGLLPEKTPLLVTRPFRSPHHTVSDAGLIGGGQIPC